MNINIIKISFKTSSLFIMLLFSQLVYSTTPAVSVDTKNTLFDFSGKAVKFEDYTKSKQWTIVMFWASDCHVCNVEVNQYVKLYRDYKNKNIRVLGVSLDGKAKKTDAQEFINIHNVNFPNLIGEPEVVANLYQQFTNEAWIGTPTFVVFSPSGKVMAQRAGMLPPELIVGFIEKQEN